MCKGKIYISHSLLFMYHIRLIWFTTNARRQCACGAPILFGCVIIYTVYYAYRASFQATYIQLDGTERETQTESSWCRIEWQLLSATLSCTVPVHYFFAGLGLVQAQKAQGENCSTLVVASCRHI